MEKVTGKETVKNMEYLVKLLHKEWERSGRTKAEVSIDVTDKKEVGAKITAEIQERQKQLEAMEMPFKECMELCKEDKESGGQVRTPGKCRLLYRGDG